MTEHFKGEKELRDTVQRKVKEHLIDTKELRHDISFGQAVVTHHYMQRPLDFHAPKSLFKADDGRARSPQKEIVSTVNESR
jgi:hypothetical protein